VKTTNTIPNPNVTNAAVRHQSPVPKLALLPDPSLLTWWRTIPKRLKSIAREIRTKIQATKATVAPAREPIIPCPRARRKAMKARPVSMGCRTRTRVREAVVPPSMLEMAAWSMREAMAAGL